MESADVSDAAVLSYAELINRLFPRLTAGIPLGAGPGQKTCWPVRAIRTAHSDRSTLEARTAKARWP